LSQPSTFEDLLTVPCLWLEIRSHVPLDLLRRLSVATDFFEVPPSLALPSPSNSDNDLTLLKQRKPTHNFLRILKFPLQHPPVFLTPHPDHTLELLRPDIEPFCIVKDIVIFRSLRSLRQDIKCPQQLRERDEEGIAREVHPRTYSSTPTFSRSTVSEDDSW
jgi:hypothetical protein